MIIIFAMAKKKMDHSKKKISPWQIFLFGVVVGMGILWLPIDHEFKPVNFSKASWSKAPAHTFVSFPLPQTAPIIERQGYTLAYDGRTRNPYWVYHKISSDVFEKKLSRDEYDFQEDSLIPQHIRATKTDYQGSGFDRGHLCPAADIKDQKGLEETFFLSNIAPQVPAFNRGYWKKIENHIRELTKQTSLVHVFTGPLYLAKKPNGKNFVKYKVIGSHNVAVPTHFFALIFIESATKKIFSKGYIVPNSALDPNIPLKKFSASLEEIETASGIVFTPILDEKES